MTRNVEQAFTRMSELQKVASRLGADVGGLSKLQYAATMSEVKPEALTTGLDKMNRTIGEALTGNKAAATSFEALGLSVKALSKMDATSAFAQIAEKLKNIETPAERAAAAAAIFGKGASELSGLITQGAAGIGALGKEAERFGIALSAVDLSKIESADMAFKQLGASVLAVWNHVAINLAPALGALLKDVLAHMPAVIAGAKVLGGVMGEIVATARNLLSPLSTLASHASSAMGIMARAPDTSWLDEYNAKMQAAAAATEAASRATEEFFTNAQKTAADKYAAFTKKSLAESETLSSPLEKYEKRVSHLRELSQTLNPKTGMNFLNTEQLDRGLAQANEKYDSDYAQTFAGKAEAATKKAMDGVKAFGKSLFEETRTPLENLEDKLQSVYDWFQKTSKSAADEDLMYRGMASAGLAYDSALGEDKDSTKINTNSFKVIDTANIDVRGLSQATEQPVKVKELQRTNELLARIVELTGPKTAVIGA